MYKEGGWGDGSVERVHIVLTCQTTSQDDNDGPLLAEPHFRHGLPRYSWLSISPLLCWIPKSEGFPGSLCPSSNVAALNIFLLSTFNLALLVCLLRMGDQTGLKAQVVIHKLPNTISRNTSLRIYAQAQPEGRDCPLPGPAPGSASAAGFHRPAGPPSGRATP